MNDCQSPIAAVRIRKSVSWPPSSSGATGDGSGGILDALTDPVPEALADPSQSGTRLKLNYYAGADGSKLAAGLHDSTLNVDCQFQTMSDGTLRCVPLTKAAFVDVYYSDAACSQQLAISVGCTGSAEYAYRRGAAEYFTFSP